MVAQLQQDITNKIINNRYVIKSKIGQGGMGIVYRALDRLTGVEVALKRVTAPGEQLIFATTGATGNFRRHLAEEFRLLASLRHPNIISVLDYGFDADRQPFFTMELLENAENVLEYGADKPFETKVELLIQTLQALAYLHRRGIIHRDLKPDNVLTLNGQVRVLDFGLAVARDYVSDSQEDVAGTIAYLAPEVLQQSHPHTEQSDLYAVGMMAFELFMGEFPFNKDNITQLVMEIVSKPIDTSDLAVDERLKAPISRLLSKEPADRYDSAHELVNHLADKVDEISLDTLAIRESYLQAAEFVGRDRELAQLTDALVIATRGEGSAWLVGGESGVGKSRLMDEMRTQAMVNGTIVLRGQAVSEGGAPYQLWRAILRHMCLERHLPDLDASVLKPLVPDIETLLDRTVPPAPELEPQAAQARLLSVIEGVFRQQTQSMVLLLEDLQWGAESLIVLKRLLRIVDQLPLLIIGSFRNDEAPNLPSELQGMSLIELTRLTTAEIAELSTAMLGASGGAPHVVDLLERETEGNIFFIVEVMRALAEEIGELDMIGLATLPQHVFAEGMQTIIARRLNQVPASAFDLLRIAAVSGRRIDTEILKVIAPDTDIEKWLIACAEASVIEIIDEHWRFAHDKLREEVLDHLTEAETQKLHGQVLTTIEHVYPDDTTKYALLAVHAHYAEDIIKESHYSALAGEQSLANGANQEAVNFLERAIKLTKQLNPNHESIAKLEYLLGESYYALGRMPDSRTHIETALTLLDAYPKNKKNLTSALVGQVFGQLWTRIVRRGMGNRTRRNDNESLIIASRACERLTQVFYIDNDKIGSAFCVLQGLNLAEKAGVQAQSEQARFYSSMSVAAGSAPLHRIAEMYIRLANKAAEKIDDLDAKGWVTLVQGVYTSGRAQWERAETLLKDSIDQFHTIGNIRRWEEGMVFLATNYIWEGRWEESVANWHDLIESADKYDDMHIHSLALYWSSILHLFQDDGDYAEKAINDMQNLIVKSLDDSFFSRVNMAAIQTLFALYRGDVQSATMFAEQISQFMEGTEPTGVGVYAVHLIEVTAYLMLMEADASAVNIEKVQPALKRFVAYSKIFDVGMPMLKTFESWLASLTGDHAKASRLTEEALQHAKTLKMPFDEAVASFHAGRLLPADDANRVAHLSRARHIFKDIDAKWYLKQIDDIL